MNSIWSTQFFGDFHYKIHKCSCGRENRVRMKFRGSGHDDFNVEKKLDIIMHQYNYDRSFFPK